MLVIVIQIITIVLLLAILFSVLYYPGKILRPPSHPITLESYPTELEYESLISSDGSKILDKRNTVFFNLVLVVIANGFGKSIYQTQLKLSECGFFISIPDLRKILTILAEEGLIDYGMSKETNNPTHNPNNANDSSD